MLASTNPLIVKVRMNPILAIPTFKNVTNTADYSFVEIGNVQGPLGTILQGATIAVSGAVAVSNLASNPVEVSIVNNTATNGFIPYYSTSEPNGPPQQYFYELTSSTDTYWSKFKKMLFGNNIVQEKNNIEKEDNFFRN